MLILTASPMAEMGKVLSMLSLLGMIGTILIQTLKVGNTFIVEKRLCQESSLKECPAQILVMKVRIIFRTLL